MHLGQCDHSVSWFKLFFINEILPTDNNGRIVLSVVVGLDVNIETCFSLAIFDLALVVDSAFVQNCDRAFYLRVSDLCFELV